MGISVGADVVIVGGGSCGAVLAARLSEDPARTVLVLESGPSDSPVPAPAHLLPIGPGAPRVRPYPTLLRPGVPATLVRGVGIGGSGAVNGAYFVRARASDLDSWPGALWSYDQSLAYFRRSECEIDFGDDTGHGRAGPIPVRRRFESDRHPVTQRFVAAARAAGFADEPDKNAGAGPSGIGPVPCNITADGARADPARVYLPPDVRDRPNLTIRTGSPVRRIRTRGGRATGVEVDTEAGAATVSAGTVVVSAGAVETPRLLWRSSIGDPDVVGGAFTDHPEITIPYRPVEVPRSKAAPPPAPLLEACLNLDDEPNLHGCVEIRPYTASFGDAVPGNPPMLPVIGVALMTPRSRGTMRPGALLEHRYLADPHDLADARSAVELARGLIESSGLGVAQEPVLGTSQHLSGTCPMGADGETSVVDERCRVHGTDGLFIADTSVFPGALARGPHATAVMLAERAAEFVAGAGPG